MSHPSEHQSHVEIFQSHYGLVVAAASRHVPTPDLVYDVVHQVFIEFMEAAGQGRLDRNKDVGPFLYQMAKNKAIDYWRHNRKFSSEGFRYVSEQLMRMRQEDAENEEMTNREMIALDICLEKLPEKSREMIELHYFRQLSLEKLSQSRSIPSATLRKAIFRIRRKLHDCILLYMKKYAGDDQ